ncbi:AAA family ATPase [Lactobacillus taiwanensis]|uniref:AAA family ATPase n=1 Tax=Lactobacillus taiwanensis TaxID=508451 RepID=UPI0025AA0B5E|nr:AAA family ATPase [Lactobacillus taiwanensis]
MVKGLIYLAKAGTGKTTFITSGMPTQFKDKNVLYITFTNQNTDNLRDKLYSSSIAFKDYEVLTFYQFLFREMIVPYKLSIKYNLGLKYDISGLYFRNGEEISKNRYICKNNSQFWQNQSGNLFGDKLAALLTDPKNKIIFDKAVKRLENFYDYIVMDEFQDIVNPELKVIQKLGSKIFETLTLKLILVGDLYQSCVEKTAMSLSPYDKFNSNMTEEEFVRNKLNLKKRYFDIDNTFLKDSYRVPKNICTFVKSFLGIDIQSKNKNKGKLKYIKSNKILESLIEDDSYEILTYDKFQKQKIKNKFNISDSRMINYGVAKGMEYPNTLIFLTKPLAKALDSKSSTSLKITSRNKFYVALTRSEGNVYLISPEIY